MIKKQSISIGLVGLGTVGSGVAEILLRQKNLLSERIGVPLVLKKVAEKDRKKALRLGLKGNQIASSWKELVEDPSIPILVELIGGTTEAKKIILAALRNGKHVVTANKALLATSGKELFELAHRRKLDICFEAAVGGGIPILRALREGLVANQIKSIHAIINGTCNYILSEMSERGEEFASVLKKAQELGYAERDPRFDIDGIDAAHKLALLIAIAYGIQVKMGDIFIEGIRRITPFDFECAQRFHFSIKLLAIAKKSPRGIEARVQPCMIPVTNPLSSVREAFNAILIDGDYVGPSLLYGKGAGKNPTASAVVGDIVEIARNLLKGVSYTVPPLGYERGDFRRAVLAPIESMESEYYLRFSVVDRPGVLSRIAGILGREGISISSVYQHGQGLGRTVPIVILTHLAKMKSVLKSIQIIDRLSVVKAKTLLVPIENG
jgi:homoserine dehydrogenase